MTAVMLLIAGILGCPPNVCAAPPRADAGTAPTLQLLRNATMKLTYGGTVFLTDPMLSRQGEIQPFAGVASNPTVELPCPLAEILTNVDALVVSHVHPDHFHRAAEQGCLLDQPVFCQPVDQIRIHQAGFQNVVPVSEVVRLNGITITRISGQHGSGAILEHLGTVSGFVFQADHQPTLYWTGDTIWCPAVQEAIRRFRPDVIVTHSGGATIPGFDPIIMDARQTLAVARAAPHAKVVAVHLEALDHCQVSRQDLRTLAEAEGIAPSRLIIPVDGQVVSLQP